MKKMECIKSQSGRAVYMNIARTCLNKMHRMKQRGRAGGQGVSLQVCVGVAQGDRGERARLLSHMGVAAKEYGKAESF